MISFVSAGNYLPKVSKLSSQIVCERCSMLKMSMLMIFNINDGTGVVLSAFVVNSKHISNIVLIVVFVKRLLGSY